MHVRDRQTVLVLGLGQGDAIAFLRHVLTDDPHACHVLVGIERGRELAAPGAGIEEGRHEGQAEAERLELVAADEATRGIVLGLVMCRM